MLQAALQSGAAARRAVFEVFARRLPGGPPLRGLRRPRPAGRRARALPLRAAPSSTTWPAIVDDTDARAPRGLALRGRRRRLPRRRAVLPREPGAHGRGARSATRSCSRRSCCRCSTTIRQSRRRRRACVVRGGRPAAHRDGRTPHARAGRGRRRPRRLRRGLRRHVEPRGGPHLRRSRPWAPPPTPSRSPTPTSATAFAAQVEALGTRHHAARRHLRRRAGHPHRGRGRRPRPRRDPPRLGRSRGRGAAGARAARRARRHAHSDRGSGDLDEHEIERLAAAPIDSYGVGTALVTGSGAPTAELIYKLVRAARSCPSRSARRARRPSVGASGPTACSTRRAGRGRSGSCVAPAIAGPSAPGAGRARRRGRAPPVARGDPRPSRRGARRAAARGPAVGSRAAGAARMTEPWAARSLRRRRAERLLRGRFARGGGRRGGGGRHHRATWPRTRDDYDAIVATRDRHRDPGAHFAAEPDYVDSWPPHCVVGTPGAELHPALDTSRIDEVFDKGEYAAAYSGFEGVSADGSVARRLAAGARRHRDRRGRPRHRLLRARHRARRGAGGLRRASARRPHRRGGRRIRVPGRARRCGRAGAELVNSAGVPLLQQTVEPARPRGWPSRRPAGAGAEATAPPTSRPSGRRASATRGCTPPTAQTGLEGLDLPPAHAHGAKRVADHHSVVVGTHRRPRHAPDVEPRARRARAAQPRRAPPTDSSATTAKARSSSAIAPPSTASPTVSSVFRNVTGSVT